MIASQLLRPALMAFAIAGWLAPGRPCRAQATRVPVAPRGEAKEKAKEAARPVDLNSAPFEELTTLPGIGDASARKIIDARPHRAVADLAGLSIPARTIDGLKELAVVRPLPAPVDINEAAVGQLETLPGVGPALAGEIVAGRPYRNYDDLGKLRGVGPAKLDALRGRVKFGTGAGAATRESAKAKEVVKAVEVPRAKEAAPPAAGAKVNLNTATEAELDALPGIGPARAKLIIEGRPYSKIEDIMKLKGIKEVEFGKVKDLITVK